MKGKLKTFRGKDGTPLYPRTHAKGVKFSDGENAEEKVSQLAQKINNKADVVKSGKTNLFDPSLKERGKAFNIPATSAYIREASNTVAYSMSPYIAISGGKSYYIGKSADSKGSAFNSYVFFDDKDEYISGGSFSTANYAIVIAPSNAKKIRFSYYDVQNNDSMCQLVESDTIVDEYIPFGQAASTMLSPLVSLAPEHIKQAQGDIETKVLQAITDASTALSNQGDLTKLKTTNKQNLVESINESYDELNALKTSLKGGEEEKTIQGEENEKYVKGTGAITAGTSGYMSILYDLHDVAGKTIHVKSPITKNQYVGVCALVSSLASTAVQNPVVKTSESSEVEINLADYPNANYMYVSVTESNKNAEVRYVDKKESLFEKVDEIEKNVLSNRFSGYISKIESISAGSTFIGDVDAVCGNKHLSFIANTNGNFTGVEFGQGKTSYAGAYVSIDNTNVSVYDVTKNASLLKTEAHGLSFNKVVGAYIIVDRDNTIHVKVTGDEGVYTMVYSSKKNVCNGEIFITANSNLTNVVISNSSRNYSSNVWFIGDSYINTLLDSRWGYHLVNTYNVDAMILGFPGSAAAAMYERFVAALSYSIPKIAVWCIGMNDRDSDTAINASWKANTDLFLKKCKEFDIEPILQLIPNVKGGESAEDTGQVGFRNHRFKNEYIQSLNVRTIDIPTLVGADENGNWNDGWLNGGTDGVHPSAISAPIIAAFMIENVPECLIK